MESNNGSKPAHPTLAAKINGHEFIDYNKGYDGKQFGGLTKREMFAMAAMQGIISGFDKDTKCNGCYIPSSEYSSLMSQAVQLADELLKQLES